MPGQSLQTDAYVLLKRPPAESFQSLTLFSVEHGSLIALQRVMKKAASTQLTLDLFDEAALVLESSNQARTWFVKEARVLKRHTEIGQSYEVLSLASRFTGLIARNTVHEESREAVGELLRGALAAFARGVRPEVVYFKSLYRFARDEGYPLKQQWFPTLPAGDRAEVVTLLNRPLAEQTLAAPAVNRLERRLEEFLKGHTDILVD